MRPSILYIQVLLLSVYQISSSISNSKIKKCDYSSLCLDLLTDLSIEVMFNIPPKTIDHGELVHSENRTLTYISKPKITKQNTVIFKFTPELIGSYSFHFNRNLICPHNKMIIVKRPIHLTLMPRSLFISEQQKMTEYSLNMFFAFDYNIEVNKDKGDIRGFALGKTGTGEEMKLKSIMPNCHMASNDTKTVSCLDMKELLSGNTIGFYYYDRCNMQNTLGFLSVIISSSVLSSPLSMSQAESQAINYPSLLIKLQPHYIKQYQKDKVILITFVISSEKRNDIEVLYTIASPLANKYHEFVFSYAEWEKDSYLTLHFDLKNDGYVKIVIYDFSTENLFIQNVASIEQIESIIIALSKFELEWTSQNMLRWMISKIGMKLGRDKENSYYFLFCSFCFVFLVVLRCYLVNRKRPIQPSSAASYSNQPSFGYNAKKAN